MARKNTKRTEPEEIVVMAKVTHDDTVAGGRILITHKVPPPPRTGEARAARGPGQGLPRRAVPVQRRAGVRVPGL
jgi:hypothetical protein